MQPSDKDISPTSGLDLDERCALEHFAGLDQSEALKMFQRNAEKIHVYLGDFVHMGDRAFEYFLPSLSRFLDGLPGDTFIEDAPEIADYVLIRFSSGGPLPEQMTEFLRMLAQRLREFPVADSPTLPARLAHYLAKYKETEQPIGLNSGFPPVPPSL